MCTNMGGRGGSSGLRGGSSGLINVSSMPKLSGSEKQVKWAEQIRNNAINSVNSNIKLANERYEKYKTDSYLDTANAYKQIANQLDSTLNNITSASILIDKRNTFSPNRIDKLASDIEEEIRRKRRK